MISATLLGLHLFTVSLIGQGVGAIQVWNSTDAIPTAVPADCRLALVYNITCANNLVTAQDAVNEAALMGDSAKQYCTQVCHDSIQTFQKNIRSSCGSKQYELYQNDTTKSSPAVLADGLMWAYELTCIQDSSGFCLADLYNRKKGACSDCTMKYGAVMMSSDYGRRKFPPAAYSSLRSSCSVPASSYPYTYAPLPTVTTTSGTPTGPTSTTPISTCTGKIYVSMENDTCKSISKANSMSTDRLVEVNHLDYACSSLTSGTELCIKDTCTVYTVQQNQTCQDIVKGQSFGLVQLVGWNPTIHQNCDNLDTMIGRSICVSPPGGGNFNPPKNRTSSSRGLASSIVTSWVSAETTIMPNISTSWYSPTIHTDYSQPIPTLTMNSTLSSLMAERTQYCWMEDEDYAEGNTIIPDDLAEDCQSLYSTFCEPEPTGPIPSSKPAIPKSCTPYRPSTTVPGSSSKTLTPSGTGIATPSPTQSGMTDGCTKFRKVKKGESCQQIADESGISSADFLAWNPAVGDDCKTLKYDFYVCVGRSSASPTSTSRTDSSPTTTTHSDSTTPTPTQPGMVQGCTHFHKVKKGEYCQQIADDNHVSLNDITEWNPDIGKDCKNLKYDFYLCVGKS